MFFRKKEPKEKAYLSRKWNDISVYYTEELDGGGLAFADDYVGLLADIKDQITCGRIYEWCSGPAFIAYALLAHGYGTSLCLADIYPPAVEALKLTAKANRLEDRVDVYLGDSVSALPPHEKLDLVVGNPPQFQNRIMLEYLYAEDPKINPRIYVDPEWKYHRQFFLDIREHLNREGLIILTECSGGAHVETFRPMIEKAGLVLHGWKWPRRGTDMFYIFIKRDDAEKPFVVP